jgi:hypothetical protein
VRRLREEEEHKKSMACALEEAKLAADMAQRSLSDALQVPFLSFLFHTCIALAPGSRKISLPTSTRHL